MRTPAMNSREVVRRTIRFEGADRMPYALAPDYGSDFEGVGMSPSPDARFEKGRDEWGCVWDNIGVSSLGEVKEHPLKDWNDWNKLKIPEHNGARLSAGNPRLLPQIVGNAGAAQRRIYRQMVRRSGRRRTQSGGHQGNVRGVFKTQPGTQREYFKFNESRL